MEVQAKCLLDLITKGAMPRYLYKYRAIDKNTEKIITDNELYFNSPVNFNDPYDCNIPIDSTSSDENIRNWYSKAEPNNPNKKDVNFYIQYFKENPNYVPTHI